MKMMLSFLIPWISLHVYVHFSYSQIYIIKYIKSVAIHLNSLIWLRNTRWNQKWYKKETFGWIECKCPCRLVGWLVVFNIPSTARSFRDGTPIYCPLRRTWSSINTPFRPGIEPRAVAWQSITLPLRGFSFSILRHVVVVSLYFLQKYEDFQQNVYHIKIMNITKIRVRRKTNKQ